MPRTIRQHCLVAGGRILRHLMLAAACSVLVMVPDHIYQLQHSGYQTRFSAATFTILTLAFALGLSASTAVFVSLAGLLALLQFAELEHFAYFGSLISPQAVILLFSESAEIFQTFVALIGQLALLPVVLAGLELSLLIVLFRQTRHWQVKSPFAWVTLLSLFVVLPVKAHNPQARAQEFYPNPREYAVANALFAVSYFVGRDLPRRMNDNLAPLSCVPYRVDRIGPPLADNIILIMGESLSAAHMSLFGYARDTTPQLRALADNRELSATIAYSAGVLTKVSLPMFYNVQREPGNFTHMVRMESNLFRLAKRQGFSTHYISAQSANLATYVGERFIDDFQTREGMEHDVAQRKDRVLFDRLKKINLKRRNFIVLHQRNSHSPYDKQYPPEFERYPTQGQEFTDYIVNSYDNSILFTDDLVAGIIRYLKRHSARRTLLLFTADHAELMGESGKFGHGHLQIENARVPFIIYVQNLAPDILTRLSSLSQPTHYEIGKEIAAILGYRIVNPNETRGVYYVTGQDIDGQSGYLTLDKRMSPPRATLAREMMSASAICPTTVVRADKHPAAGTGTGNRPATL